VCDERSWLEYGSDRSFQLNLSTNSLGSSLCGDAIPIKLKTYQHQLRSSQARVDADLSRAVATKDVLLNY